MESSKDESNIIIDSLPGIIVDRYRLTDFDCAPPLYIILTDLPFLYLCNSNDETDSFSIINGREG